MAAIRTGVKGVSAANWLGKPRAAANGMLAFARASGTLLEEWLTPQRIAECEQFWTEGSTTLIRDFRRGRMHTIADVQAVLW